MLGDSLSAGYGLHQEQGWVHLLNQHFNNNNLPYHIINASISGETTGGGLARLPQIFDKENFQWLIIELGGNDGLRGFNPNIIRENLTKMINLAQQKNVNVAVINIRIPPNYGPRYNSLFNQVFIDVTQEKGVPLLPFFMENIAINPELMLPDGIHPNLAAQPLIKKFMLQEVKQLIGE